MNSEPRQDELSGRVGRLLHDLPPRPAPATLEARVRRQLAHGVATSAHDFGARRGFAGWPFWGRFAFVMLSAALSGYSVLDTSWRLAARPFDAAAAMAAAWLQPAVAVMASAGVLTDGLARSVPPAWLSGLAATLVALYTVLFALGAAAYRTLYVEPLRLGDST
jgi:hypothetical protein